jgi:phosphatidylethanolamine/phosphatidyl-N-methylethanolamine N-methyltransferase
VRHGSTTPAVEAVYKRLAPVYDLLYGVGLQHGRRRAMARLSPRPGERILEIGVGTGLSAVSYPSGCQVVAIDLSAPMLARAHARLARRRVAHVALCRMDATRLAFPDARFDAIYAPYVINVVPDPLQVAREMRRVCRPGGRLVFLNHFAPADGCNRVTTRLAGSVATRATGVNWNLELDAFLRDAGLTALSVEEVNLRVSSVVLCAANAND